MLSEFTVTRKTKADLPVKNEIRLYEERFGGIKTIIAYVTEDAIAGKPHKYIWNTKTSNWDLVEGKEEIKMNNENKNYDTDRTSEDLGTVKSLGSGKTKYPTQYDPSVLETFINKHPDNEYVVSFDAYEFTSLCVTGDTMIDVATNESENPAGVPIQDLVGSQGYVFCVDPDTLEPLCRKYKCVKKTGSNVPVVKIIMDALRVDGHGRSYYERTYLKCTPDHPILVKSGFRDSKWIPAKDLQPGMRLIADQRSGDTTRGKIRHRLIAECLFDEDIQEVHHIDNNHFSNDPANLSNMSPHDHRHNHRSAEYGYDNTLNIDDLIKLYNAGENFSSLAKMFHCDESTIESRIGHLVDKRSQSESLSMKNRLATKERDDEICRLYEKGYLLSEIADYLQIHSTTALSALESRGIARRESNFARYNRRKLNLPSLNHKVVAVVDEGTADVYNMEVEDVENYFANGVVVHNCPLTHQPDLAKIVISYIPNERMVESKSLKLYLFSYRNHGSFHEDCVNTIMKDLVELMDPKYIEVRGIFAPRGGISIFPFATYADSEHKDLERQRRIDILRDSSNRAIRYDM